METEKKNLDTILCEAVEITSEEERQAYLDRVCGDDTALRSEAERLISHHFEARDFLEKPAVVLDPTIDQHISEKPGTQIGPYKLLQQIGEGGMGVVYMAEQKEPVKRRVALKIIKPGMDTRQVVARFEAERQALAMMEHPHIARAIDIGQTSSGRPYFVMELVKGVPITQYCDEHRLSTRERMELFIPVCQAVQHAHQKGIIHRDLKPSNILVAEFDNRAIPKVIDFGVAKALNQVLTEKTMFTQLGQVIGTLDYMSPEQAKVNQMDVDTRSDIYSLGVILYELLTGSTPFDQQRLRSAAWDEVMRIIREEEPPRPSLRLRSSAQLPALAAQRRSEPTSLSSSLTGELDWVVMKALDKERNRRYETANGLAFDIQRYLSDEPVLACPPTRRYRFRKFARRNRVTLLTVTAVVVSLLIGLTVAVQQAIRAGRAEYLVRLENARVVEEQGRTLELSRKAQAAAQRAREEEEIASAVKEFLLTKLLGQADPIRQAETARRLGLSVDDLRADVTIRELLDRASAELSAERLDSSFPAREKLQSELLHTVGMTYLGVGEYEQGRTLLDRAYARRLETFGPESAEALASMGGLAMCNIAAADWGVALPMCRERLRLIQARYGSQNNQTFEAMTQLAIALRGAGYVDDSLPLDEEVLRGKRALFGEKHGETLRAMDDLGRCYLAASKPTLAIPLFEQAFEERKKLLRESHPETLFSMMGLANAYYDAGMHERAVTMYQEHLRISRAVRGEDHPHTLSGQDALATCYWTMGHLDQAVTLLEDVVRRKAAKIGQDHPATLASQSNLAHVHREAGRLELAIPLYEDVLERNRVNLGDDHPMTMGNMSNLGDAYRESGKLALAESLLSEAHSLFKLRLGPNHANTLTAAHNLALTYDDIGRLADATALCEETLRRREEHLGPNHPHTLYSLKALAGMYLADRGRRNEGNAMLETLVPRFEKVFGPSNPRTLGCRMSLGTSYLDVGDLERARVVYEETLQILEEHLGPDNADTLRCKSYLAITYQRMERSEAIPLFEQILVVQEASLGAMHPNTVVTRTYLGMGYRDAGRLEDAAPVLELAYQGSRRLPTLEWVIEEWVPVLLALGRTEEAHDIVVQEIAQARGRWSAGSLDFAERLAWCGERLLEAGDAVAAEPVLRESHALLVQARPDRWSTLAAKSALGGALLAQAKEATESDRAEADRKLSEARSWLVDGCDGLMTQQAAIPKSRLFLVTSALERMVDYHETTREDDEAAKRRSELENWRSRHGGPPPMESEEAGDAARPKDPEGT